MLLNHPDPGRWSVRFCLVAVLSTFVYGSTAFAQAQRSSQRGASQKAQATAPAKAAQPGKGKTAAKNNKEKGCGPKATSNEPITPNPEAKYSVPQDTIVHEPVWEGEKLRFSFPITNKGTAPLRIRAKGG